jgi:hypothetical protein
MSTIATVLRLTCVVRIGVRLDIQQCVYDSLGGQFGDTIKWITDQALRSQFQGFEYVAAVYRHPVLAVFEREISAAETLLASAVVYTHERAAIEVRDAPQQRLVRSYRVRRLWGAHY